MRVTVFIAASLDGFIARSNDSLDWLNEQSEKAAGEEYGYDALMASVDYLVMGRRTFEVVSGFPDWPYEGKRLIVLSRTLKKVPAGFEGRVELFGGSINELMARLQEESCEGIYIDGGRTVQSFLNEGLVTDIIITRIPILIGEGKPLFGKLEQDIQLKLVDVKPYPSGFVRTHYQPR